jgi:hypothetical protein
LLPWLGLHVDGYGCLRPCSPATSRVTLGYAGDEASEAHASSAAAGELRHRMVTLQWTKTCRASCPVLQHAPIDLLASAPPTAEHPGTGGVAIDRATWARLQGEILADPERASAGLFSLTIEEGRASAVLPGMSFAQLRALRLVLDPAAPLGPELEALVRSIREQAGSGLSITIESPARCFDAALAERCLSFAQDITLTLSGASAHTLDRLEGRGAWQRVLANLDAAGPTATLLLEISSAAIAEIGEFFQLARSRGMKAKLRRSRSLLGREDPFATRNYRELARLALVLQDCAVRYESIWVADDRRAWSREPLLARHAERLSFTVGASKDDMVTVRPAKERSPSRVESLAAIVRL